MEGIDLSKELQEFYEKNKDNKLIRNYEETLKDSKGGFFKVSLLKNKVINYRLGGRNKYLIFF